MKEVLEKLRKVETELSTERGSFNLFALFLREDAPDVWDLVVAAPWTSANRFGVVQEIAAKVQANLDPNELTKLSRIVVFEQNNPALAAVQRALHVEHGRAEIRDSNLFGLQIKHAFVITSRAGEEPTHSVAK